MGACAENTPRARTARSIRSLGLLLALTQVASLALAQPLRETPGHPNIPSPPSGTGQPQPGTGGAPKRDQARTSLLPMAQPLWSELTGHEQQALAELEPQWNSLPAAKKRSWLMLAKRLPGMPPADRERAEARIREWARLSPDQRRQARNNYRLAKSLPRDARVATWEQYQQMTPEQQAVLRQNGWTSNTAARHAGAPTGLAKEAARPIPGVTPQPPKFIQRPEPVSGSGSESPASTLNSDPGSPSDQQVPR